MLADSAIIGTVVELEEGCGLAIEGLKDTVMPLVLAQGAPNPAGFKNKRVQIMGASDGKRITLKSIDELQPREKDLVFKVKSKGVRARVLEYLPNKNHRHPGQSCKSHAWTREEADGAEGSVTREFRVPAYKARTQIRVLVRIEGKEGAADSEEFSWNGEMWLDKNLDAVEKAVEVALEAP